MLLLTRNCDIYYSMRYIFNIVILCFYLILPFNAAGQEVRALIIRVEGQGFSLVRDGKLQYFDFTTASPIGFEFFAEDIINVDANTFLEIKISPSNILIRVSESTSIKLAHFDKAGSGGMDMIYGRVRVKTDKDSTTESFKVDGLRTASGSEGADFGSDLIYNTETGMVNQIYCLDGTVEITKDDSSAGDDESQTVSLNSLEMVTIPGDNQEEVVQKKQLASDVISYWQDNDFETEISEETVLAQAEEEVEEEVESKETDQEQEELQLPVEPQTEPNGFKHFWLDVGLEVCFLVFQNDDGGLDDPLSQLIDFFTFLSHIKGGFVIDFSLMFIEYFGLGIETGLLYNTMTFDTYRIHNFSVPGFGIIRFNLGPLFLQLYGGVEVIGSLLEDAPESLVFNLQYDVGAKLGINVGDVFIYAVGGLNSEEIQYFFDGRFNLRFGLGVLVNVTKF